MKILCRREVVNPGDKKLKLRGHAENNASITAFYFLLVTLSVYKVPQYNIFFQFTF